MTTTCATCAFPIAAAARGLCARCLLHAGLSPSSGPLPRPFGKYTLLAKLGEGGSGVVFRARDPDLEREVALKVLKGGDGADSDHVVAFQTEARDGAALRHEGIVRVLDVGSCDGQPFFTMDLIEGRTLATCASEFRGRPRTAAALIAAVARAIQHAHKNLLLHCDLKPENILLDEAGNPHVADFGIARRVGDASSGGGPIVGRFVFAGTRPYMAPERWDRARAPDVAVDVYGLGAILHELLSGEPPVASPPSGLRLDADPDLQAVCMKCLRRAPEERYASAAAVAADLERYLADEEVTARRPSRRERAARIARRHPTGTVLAGSALLLLATTAVVAVSVARAQEHELRADVLKVNAYAARALAGAVLYELRDLADQLERGVGAAAPAALHAVLERPESPPALAAWRRLPLPPRFDSLLLLDEEGRAVARTPAGAVDLRDERLDWRDYFGGAATHGSAARAWVSRGYVSRADGTARFAVALAVRDAGGALRGVVAGGVDSAVALGSLTLIDPGEPGRIASLLARRDRERRDDPLPDDWMVLLHEGVAHGSVHRPIPARAATPAARAQDDDYRDPVPGFEGRWLAGLAPVPGTPFVAVVQTRHDAAIAANQRLARRLRLAGLFALAVATSGALLLLGVQRHRRRRARA